MRLREGLHRPVRPTPFTPWKRVIVTARQIHERYNTRDKLRAYIASCGLDPDRVLIYEETASGALVFAQRDRTRQLGA